MTTIKEMADDYAKSMANNPYVIEIYKAGANAVLEEFSNLLDHKDVEDIAELYGVLYDKIKELKGE